MQNVSEDELRQLGVLKKLDIPYQLRPGRDPDFADVYVSVSPQKQIRLRQDPAVNGDWRF